MTVILLSLAFVCGIFDIILSIFTDSIETKYDYYYLKMDKKNLKRFKKYLMICNFGEVFIVIMAISLVIFALYV